MKNSLLLISILSLLSCKPKNECTMAGSFTKEQDEKWIYLQKAYSDELGLGFCVFTLGF